MMGSQRLSSILVLCLLIFTISSTSSTSTHENFIQCLSHHSPPSIPITNVVYTPKNSSYTSVLESTAQNLEFLTPNTPKPLFIVTPLIDSHVQTIVICCRKHGLQIKTRSGGHDFEGLSFTSDIPSFIILDLVKMKSIDFDLDDNSAWVQTGVTNGELFYELSKKSNVHGFPAGTFPSVGFGGLISGGGIGTLVRKYGVAAENILDAKIVVADGRILDKKIMGEDLFWAIRGGGGASFGVILAWKIKLVPVPPIITVFTVPRTLDQGASKLFYKWQYIGHTLPQDIFFRIMIRNIPGNTKNNKTIEIQFRINFLGRADDLIQIMEQYFPELGVKRSDCKEMSYVETIVYFSNYPEEVPVEALINRAPNPKSFLKAKSDFATKPISESGLEGLWDKCMDDNGCFIVMDAFGGILNEIPESTIPFPHRKGILYSLLYFATWTNANETDKHLEWSRSLYEYMAPYVSQNPRTTYVNTRDLDIGRNKLGRKTTYSQAKVWGQKCFKGNFKRLALVKGKVDPTNFFTNEQSIPPLKRW